MGKGITRRGWLARLFGGLAGLCLGRAALSRVAAAPGRCKPAGAAPASPDGRATYIYDSAGPVVTYVYDDGTFRHWS